MQICHLEKPVVSIWHCARALLSLEISWDLLTSPPPTRETGSSKSNSASGDVAAFSGLHRPECRSEHLGPDSCFFVLVHMGGYNHVPQTRWLRNNKFISDVLEALSPRSECHLVGFWGGPSLALQTSHFLLCLHVTHVARELCEVSFIRALSPFMT